MSEQNNLGRDLTPIETNGEVPQESLEDRIARRTKVSRQIQRGLFVAGVAAGALSGLNINSGTEHSQDAFIGANATAGVLILAAGIEGLRAKRDNDKVIKDFAAKTKSKEAAAYTREHLSIDAEGQLVVTEQADPSASFSGLYGSGVPMISRMAPVFVGSIGSLFAVGSEMEVIRANADLQGPALAGAVIVGIGSILRTMADNDGRRAEQIYHTQIENIANGGISGISSHETVR